MNDPISAIGSLANIAKATDPTTSEAAAVGVSLWMKFLSPPAEALGTHLKSRIELWSEDQLARRVLERGAKKADTSQDGTVPPRVASDIFEKAQWAEDEFVAEYLSGVLASARTANGTDDSAVSWTALVGRLSSDQLRTHYLLYSALRVKLLGNESENIADWEQKRALVSWDSLAHSFEWPEGERQVYRFIEAFYGLEREGLLGDVGHGGRQFWEKHWQSVHRKQLPDGTGFFIFHATTAGTMLFLRAHGHGSTAASNYLSPTMSFEAAGDVAVNVPIPEVSLIDDLEALQGG